MTAQPANPAPSAPSRTDIASHLAILLRFHAELSQSIQDDTGTNRKLATENLGRVDAEILRLRTILDAMPDPLAVCKPL